MSELKATCPGCKGEIVVKPHSRVGEWIPCPHCGADLEVTSLDPVVLGWAYDGPEIAGAPSYWRSGRLGRDW